MVAKLLRPAAVALAAVLAALLSGTVAYAAYPGVNGKLVVSDNLNGFHNRLVTMNYDGSARTPITPDDFNNFKPAWSPDGSKIAFSSRHGPETREDIWIVNADGTDPQQVTAIFGQDTHPTWSPDGSKIAFSTNQDGNSEIYVVNADGTGLHNITNNVENQDTTPAWSPDGTKIAYVARTSNFSPNIPHVWVMDADGSNQTQLPPANPTGPDWAPNGSKIAYSEDHDCGGGQFCHQIHLMNPDGTGDQVISSGERRNPHWSPDGTKLVYQDGFEIGTINTDGSNPVLLPTTGTQKLDPDWQSVTVNGHVRPSGASPIRASLVPAYKQCVNFNRNHGPPLASLSCHPPVQQSATLTVGTPDANGQPAASEGSVKLAVVVGNPGTPADEADVNLQASVTDVRCASLTFACLGGAGTDYEGSLLLDVALRITDKLNGFTQNISATVQDTSLRVPFSCVATGAAVGSTCSVATSAEAVIPGIVPEGKRSVWQLGQAIVLDEGPNGTGYESCPPTCGDGDEAVFLSQGLFVP